MGVVMFILAPGELYFRQLVTDNGQQGLDAGNGNRAPMPFFVPLPEWQQKKVTFR